MIRTNIFDKNGKEIVTGDTIEFTNITKLLSKEYKEFFKIDRMTAEVIDLGNEFGLSFLTKYYSNGVRIGTYQDHLDFKLSGDDGELLNQKEEVITPEELKKLYTEEVAYRNAKMTDYVKDTPISNRTDSYSFMHGFFHPEKVIIKEKATGKEREEILSKAHLEDVVMTLDNGFKINFKKHYILELSKEAKDFVLERFMLLMEDELFDGDFTHLSFKTKKLTNSEHSFDFNPTNEHGEITYFTYNNNRDKQNAAYAEYRPINEEYREQLRKEGKTEEEVTKLGRTNWREKVKSINSDKSIMDRNEVTEMFISMTSSTDVVNKLLELGATLSRVE